MFSRVNQQEVDEKTSAPAARKADLRAAQASVARLEKLSSFKTVRIPFAGTVTRRFVDSANAIRFHKFKPAATSVARSKSSTDWMTVRKS